MSTQVSKNIYAMIEDALERGELDKLIVSFEYDGEKIPAHMLVDGIECSGSTYSTLSMESGILRREFGVDIDRFVSLETE